MTEEEVNACTEYFKKYNRVKINVLYDPVIAEFEYKTSDIKVCKDWSDFDEEWEVTIEVDKNYFCLIDEMIFLELSENRFVFRYDSYNGTYFDFYNAEQ